MPAASTYYYKSLPQLLILLQCLTHTQDTETLRSLQRSLHTKVHLYNLTYQYLVKTAPSLLCVLIC